MSNCRECEGRAYVASLYIASNNPNEYGIKYGRDHSERMLLGDMVSKFIMAAGLGANDAEMTKLIDQEFLFGSWRNETEAREPEFLRDLRGMIITLARKAAR